MSNPKSQIAYSSKVLYFPHIRVPDSEWLVRMLLYWDAVGTITPYDFVQEPDRHHPLTRRLIQEGLVTQIIPSWYVGSIPHFERAFMRYLESLGAATLDGRRKSFATDQGFLIHAEKLYTLSDQLREAGLARPGPDTWIEVEYETAHEFMAYLAAALGRLPDLGFAPVTDDESQLDLFISAGARSPAIDGIEGLRLEVLQELFPAPSRPVNITDLSHFKQKYGKELKAFRRSVEQELTVAADITDDSLRKRRIQLFLEQAQEEIQEIRKHMDESGWGGSAFGKLTAVLAAIPGVSPVVGLVTAVYEAFGGAGPEDIRSPFLYAFRAQESVLHR